MKIFTTVVEKNIHSVGELNKIYSDLLSLFKPRTLVLLMGPVGAGKTTSVQNLARLLGIDEVASPSFAIHHRYESAQGESIDHVDLYRLNDEDDLESTGFWDLFSQQKSIVIIEWAERLNFDLLPLNWFEIRVHLDIQPGSDERHIKVEVQQNKNEPISGATN